MTEQQFTTEELNSEEWKPVVDFEGFYDVSSLGRVKRVGHFHLGGTRVPFLKPRLYNAGYLFISLSRPGRRSRPYLVHRLVMAAFHYPVSGRMIQVNHIDGVKVNNRLANLEYVTAQENTRHAIENKLRLEFPIVKRRARGATHYSQTKPEAVLRGSKHGRAKINENTIPEICSFYATTKSYRKTAAHFGIGKTTVIHIIKGDSWKHVVR